MNFLKTLRKSSSPKNSSKNEVPQEVNSTNQNTTQTASKNAYEESPGVIRGVVDDEEANHRQITVAVIGAGDRGNVYSRYAKDFPQLMKIVAVAEPRKARRENFISKYGISEENAFEDWKELAKKEKFADAVIITTLDQGVIIAKLERER